MLKVVQMQGNFHTISASYMLLMLNSKPTAPAYIYMFEMFLFTL